MYLFERTLERLAVSEYKDNFILKGGLLISSMIGINERTTMDMDATVTGIAMNEDDLITKIDGHFAEVKKEFSEMRGEMKQIMDKLTEIN